MFCVEIRIKQSIFTCHYVHYRFFKEQVQYNGNILGTNPVVVTRVHCNSNPVLFYAETVALIWHISEIFAKILVPRFMFDEFIDLYYTSSFQFALGRSSSAKTV